MLCQELWPMGRSRKDHWFVLGMAPTSHQERPMQRSLPLSLGTPQNQYDSTCLCSFVCSCHCCFVNSLGCVLTQELGLCLGLSFTDLTGKPYSCATQTPPPPFFLFPPAFRYILTTLVTIQCNSASNLLSISQSSSKVSTYLDTVGHLFPTIL